MPSRLVLIIITGVLLALAGPVRLSAAGTPLLMEGKKTLYQRVATHPGAAAHAAPAGEAGPAIAPFSVFYVYDRVQAGGREWVQAAPNTLGRDLVWLPGDFVSDWKQSLTLTFAERAGRSPLLFFKSPAALEKIAERGGISSALASLGAEFLRYAENQEDPPEDFPVAAREPGDEEGAVPYGHFYLMPIFSYQEPFEGVKFLEVGSIDPGYGAPGEAAPEPAAEEPEPLKHAVVFVVDTTISMGPYIEATKKLALDIYDAIAAQGQDLGLGLVAFRNSVEAKPKVEYLTKVISPIRTGQERDDFARSLIGIQEAKASTHRFAEDSLAGIEAAIEELDWEPYQGRVVILVTDAGPLPPNDPHISTALDPRGLAQLAKTKNIRLATIHIQTPAGARAKDVGPAEAAYRQLTDLGSAGQGYLSLEAKTPEQGAVGFALAAWMLAEGLNQTVFSPEPLGPAVEKTVIEEAGGEDTARRIGEALGYSIRLEYAGRVHKKTAPRVVRSWIADQDMGRLDEAGEGGAVKAPTVACAVLLTKDQLSALSRRLSVILDNAERTQMMGARDFFQGILSASAQMVQDPSQFAAKPGDDLAKLGVLGEFLEGLPYKSRVMGMTEEDWYNMSVGEQNDFIYYLKSCLENYRTFDQDVDNWVSFDNKNSGDWLYRVPLFALP